VPVLRVLSAGLLAWGLLTLLLDVDPKVHRAGVPDPEDFRHLVLVLDVSPSMRLQDAGPDAKQSRLRRARDVLQSMFSRVSIGQYKISVIATYNGALPVVVDTTDADVVGNVLSDLPIHYAFKPGETRLFTGLEEAAKIARPWKPKSATVVIVSDGETLPAKGMVKMPPSVAGVLVVGVGDPITGSFINGRNSRQDVSALRQMALRLGGTYHDGNKRHVATSVLAEITADSGRSAVTQLTRREYALISVGLGAGVLALLPWLLHLLGTRWRPGTRPKNATTLGMARAMRLSRKRNDDTLRERSV
jgi:Ca-activated chloride channel family protein